MINVEHYMYIYLSYLYFHNYPKLFALFSVLLSDKATDYANRKYIHIVLISIDRQVDICQSVRLYEYLLLRDKCWDFGKMSKCCTKLKFVLEFEFRKFSCNRLINIEVMMKIILKSY